MLGESNVGNSSTVISNVLLVEGLKHDLLSIMQLCDKGYRIPFRYLGCIIEHTEKKNHMFDALKG